MSGLLWLFVAQAFLNAVTVVASVGKPKKPTTAHVAAGVVVIDALVIAAIFYFGWGLR
jgi:hypothetical protein